MFGNVSYLCMNLYVWKMNSVSENWPKIDVLYSKTYLQIFFGKLFMFIEYLLRYITFGVWWRWSQMWFKHQMYRGQIIVIDITISPSSLLIGHVIKVIGWYFWCISEIRLIYRVEYISSEISCTAWRWCNRIWYGFSGWQSLVALIIGCK